MLGLLLERLSLHRPDAKGHWLLAPEEDAMASSPPPLSFGVTLADLAH